MNRMIKSELLCGGRRASPGRWSPGFFILLAALVWAVPCLSDAARYDFESGKDGWTAQNWGAGKDKCTNVAQSSFWGFGGSTNSLRMDCVLTGALDTAVVGVTFDPVMLQGSQITVRVYCPSNASGSGQAWSHTQLRIFVKDKNFKFQESAWDAFLITNGISTQTLSYTVTGLDYAGLPFDSTNVTEFGIEAVWRGYGTYSNALYVDAAGFGATYVPPTPPQTITNTEHLYDMETEDQKEWWKWGTNPEGWHAKAWTNTYYATNQGYNGSVALAANAVFNTNNSAEVVTNELGQVTTNEYAFQKGVFEIAYQPALNLSTKDHRILQAKVRFSPQVADAAFVAKMYVYDKISDQWYFHVGTAGGSNWNFIEFDLDDPTQYATNLAEFPSPAGPMNASEIGFVDVLIYGSSSWTGTIYLDEVVVAGRETQTNYTKFGGDFVRAQGHKFVVGGTNFYFCGANIEYLQTVNDRVVDECLDWAASNRLQIVRTWAMQEGRPYSFQPERGVWNEPMFEHLDRIVAEAGHRNIRLMLGLVDNWAHNGGIFQYVHWATKEHPESVDTNLNKEGVLYHDQFWTNAYCKQWYKDYVTRLLNRTNSITGVIYKNDPTIFAWEIVNEPRCESDFSGRKIHNWLNEMSDFVRSIDTNHLLGNGEEGGYVNTYEFADTIPWEVYPDNYYHYATYATGSSSCDLYGCGRGHGVDFLSDCKSESTYVQWQGGFYTNRDPVSGEWRAGNSNINFCTARIYVDQKEYNVWRTNYNGADQRFEWINDHWYDAHDVIQKPMILEEFGIHAIGWIFNGSYGQVQLKRTPEYTFIDRMNVYSQYYDHIEQAGISGSFFWNFGYDGMWDDLFHSCEYVAPWFADTGYGAATSVTLSSSYVMRGSNSLRLAWNYTGAGADRAIFKCPTNDKWVLRVDNLLTNEPPTHGINRTKFFWSFYNPSAQDVKVSLAVSGGPNWYWCEGAPYTLTSGWNRIIFDLSAGHYGWTSNNWENSEYLINIPNAVSNVLEDVRQVSLVFRDLPVGAGEIFVDDIKIKRDDGFVVYADDPVVPVIKAHAEWCDARNVPTNSAGNHAPVASNLWYVVDPKSPTTISLAGGDVDGDVLSYRIITRPENGWVFGTPPHLKYVAKPGSGGSDSFSYVVNDGRRDSAEAVITLTPADLDFLRYDFEIGLQGWYANAQPWAGYGVTSVVQSADRALHAANSLKAFVDLSSASQHDYGDAEVDMAWNPPLGLIPPINLKGQPVQVSVFCPTGSAGNPANPNHIQLYAKDAQWRALWLAESNVVENGWVTFTLVVDTNTPGTWVDAGFTPEMIRAIGVRVKYGGAGSEYQGPIYIDAVRFPVMERRLIYSFTTNTEEWAAEDWGSGEAILSWTNVGNPAGGALAVRPVDAPSYGKFYIKDNDLVENENVVWKPILRALVYVPCDAPDNVHHAVQVRLVVRSSSDGWAYGHQSEPITLVPCQWNLVEWDMSGLPVSILTDADEFGVEIVWQNRDVWDGEVLVDSLQLVQKDATVAPSLGTVTAATNVVGKYRKFEVAVDLDGVEGVNPYDPNQVDLYATFTSPSGNVWKINGFYMEEGGDTPGQGDFRIRFAPNELGAWSYRVSAANTHGTNTGSLLNFSCVESGQRGWVRVSDDDAHYLEHEDDSPFVGIGYCHPWDGDDEGLFRQAEEHGINMIHWWMAPWDTMLTVKPANPNDFWREKSSYDTYEQVRAAELDRVVGHAEKHNVKLVWTIWPHDAIRDFDHHKWRINGSWAKAEGTKFSEPEWYINAFSDLDNPPKNQKFFYDDVYKEYQDRLYRYIIARWGYSEAIGAWALVSELFGTFANSANCIDYQGKWATNKSGAFGEDPYLNMDTNQCDGADYGVAWLTYINDYFKNNDPFRHPTTASYGTDEYWDGGFPIVDIPQIHVYADLYNWITPPTTLGKYHHKLHEEYDKPSFMGEIGTVEWKLYEPDYTRVTAWPGICSGAAITPMMWTTPAFSWFGDAKMGPWLGVMSDEMKVLSKFLADIDMHKLHMAPADVQTTAAGEPSATLVESFESGTNAWRLWGNGIRSGFVTNAHATHGTNAWRLNVDMDTYANMPDAPAGIEKYEDQGFVYNWTSYWPRGTLKMDVFIPEFYHPTNNPDGFLLGINKDPRSILEVFTKDEGGSWHWYSTTNEYGGDIRESGGWKKLTVGMLWNLEFNLGDIPTAYEAAHIVGFKFKFGDVGILRGPIFVDNITAGMYAYNTLAMVSSNGQFAFGWIQDRRWTNSVAGNADATLKLNGLVAGNYNVEWWDTLVGPRQTVSASAPTGTLSVTVPNFQKDIAFKVRRVGATGGTVHDVAVLKVEEFDWVIRNPRQLIEVLVANQGTVAETFNVLLTDTTAGQVVGTNAVTLAAGGSVHTRFWWNCMTQPTNAIHVLTATASTVAGETETADNTLASRTMVYGQSPPWDPCSGLRRWAPDSGDNSDGRLLTVVTNHITEGGEALEFYHRSPSKYQAYFGFDNVYENWSNRTSFALDVYVAEGSTNVQLMMRTGADWVWHYSAGVGLTNGWNRNVTFHFNTNTWTRAVWNDETEQNDYFYNVYPSGLEEIQQLFIKFQGYTNEGSVYVDNMRLDGWYALKLGMVNGVDVFPNAVAEQSNFTGAAACWMIARYLKGDIFTQGQSNIYAATSHDPAHNNEITANSAASWLYANAPQGYYFSPRYRTSLTDALKETVYWMDYVPAGGLQVPVQILCHTNWSHKLVRGFETSAKPYGALYSSFTVHGLWLKDPRLGGLGYDVYATAQEMENVYLPSTANGEYWLVCEPPPEGVALAEDQMERSTIILGGGEPNADVAAFLSTLSEPAPSRLLGRGTPPAGVTNLLAVVPDALRKDTDFLAAYYSATNICYYEVNKDVASHYFLAAGGVQGPGSTKYVIKLSPDGAFQQATWATEAWLYPFVPVEAAIWTAQQQTPDSTVVSTQLVYAAAASPSPFLPAWQVVLEEDGLQVTNAVTQDDQVTSRDSDGDGMSDAAELYAGVNPTNLLSGFGVEGHGLNAGGPKITLSWPSLEGRTYSLYRGTNLNERFTRLTSGVQATPPMNTFTDAPPSSISYYRVEVE